MKLLKSQVKLQIPDELRQAANDVYNSDEEEVSIMKVVQSNSSVALPGDVALFTYDGESTLRKVLVVKTNSAKLGKFTSSQGNKLLCCFELEQTLGTLTSVFDKLYKNSDFSSYDKFKGGLDMFFGRSKYKTFIVSKIDNFYEIHIDKKKFLQKKLSEKG